MIDIRRCFFCVLIFFAMNLGLHSQNTYNDFKSIFKDGKEVLWHERNGLTIVSCAEKTSKLYGFGKEVRIDLIIINDDHESLEINPSTIVAYTLDKGYKKALKVYSEKEYEKKVKRNILWFGPDNSESVLVESTSNTSIKDKYGDTQAKISTSSNSSSTYYTGAKNAAMNDASTLINRTYLKRNTLFKGEKQEGIIIIGNPKSNEVKLSICINGNNYIFSYNLNS